MSLLHSRNFRLYLALLTSILLHPASLDQHETGQQGNPRRDLHTRGQPTDARYHTRHRFTHQVLSETAHELLGRLRAYQCHMQAANDLDQTADLRTRYLIARNNSINIPVACEQSVGHSGNKVLQMSFGIHSESLLS